MNDEEKHVLSKHFSIGDILSLCTLMVVFAAGYGRLDAQVGAVAERVNAIESRDITAEAATRIATLENEQEANGRELLRMREDAVEFRREVRAQLDRIESK